MVHLKTRALGTLGDHLAEPAQQTGVEAMWPRQPSGDPGFPSAGPGTRDCPDAYSVRVTGQEVEVALLFSARMTPCPQLVCQASSTSVEDLLPGPPPTSKRNRGDVGGGDKGTGDKSGT